MSVILGGTAGRRARALLAAGALGALGATPAVAGGGPPLPTLPPVTVASPPAVTAAATPAPAAAPAADACGTGSWVAGTVELCEGELVYRDYVYDDYGGDRGTIHPRFDARGGMPPAGDDRYRDPAAENTADLVSLRLRVVGDRLHVRFELNTLYHPDQTWAAIAIDTDDDRSTGGGPWPGFAGPASTGWDVAHLFKTGDPATNVIAGDVPRPPGTRWRVQAVTSQPVIGVMNVAFRGPDEYGFWWDEKQAATLAHDDVSPFGHTVEVADLVGGVTRRAEVGPGIHERVYVSEHPIPPGEGVSQEGVDGHGGTEGFDQVFNFLGKYQPYGIYVPPRPGPYGIQLMLHGLEENHSGRIWFPGTEYQGARRQLGDAHNRLIVAPLARGRAGWYSSWSERDVLDVLADVEAAYPTDRTKVVIGGVSMGGYGTYRLAALHPDRFAGALVWVGYTGDCFNGTPQAGQCGGGPGARENALDLAGNLRWVPTGMLYALADEVVWANHAVAARQRFEDLGYPHRWWFHPTADHVSNVVLDEWQKESDWSKDLALVTDPHRVTFRTSPAVDDPQLGLVHDKAYWVSAIRPRADGWADVDVTSSGCGGREPVMEPTTGVGARPLPWISTGLDVKEWRTLPKADRLTATLANVASFTVDSGRACVAPGPVAYEVTTDGPATVAFTDGRSLRLDGPGTHRGTLDALPGAAVQGAGAQQKGELPATGGGTGVTALAAVAAAVVLRRLAQPSAGGSTSTSLRPPR